MKRFLSLLLAPVLVGAFLAFPGVQADDNDGWIQLFNGKDLSGCVFQPERSLPLKSWIQPSLSSAWTPGNARNAPTRTGARRRERKRFIECSLKEWTTVAI